MIRFELTKDGVLTLGESFILEKNVGSVEIAHEIIKSKFPDIEYQLKLMNNSLQDVSCKLDLVLELVKKNLMDKNGN